MTRRSFSAFLVFACAATLAGCEPVNDAETNTSSADSVAPLGHEEDLLAFWLVYTDHAAAHEQGPESWEDAIEFAKQNDEIYEVDAIERLREAGWEVVWGVKKLDDNQGTDDVQIAQLPGGPKLMISGAIVE